MFDPDGKVAKDVVVAEEDQEFILENLHAKTDARYTFNGNNELIRDNTVEQQESDAYSDKIDQAISSDEKMVLKKEQMIKSGDWGGMEVSIDFFHGGGVTRTKVVGFYDEKQKLQRRYITVISITGNENFNINDEDGNSLGYTSADILLHEIVGHGLPMMGISGSGNAITNENEVRSGLGIKERKSEKKHYE